MRVFIGNGFRHMAALSSGSFLRSVCQRSKQLCNSSFFPSFLLIRAIYSARSEDTRASHSGPSEES